VLKPLLADRAALALRSAVVTCRVPGVGGETARAAALAVSTTFAVVGGPPHAARDGNFSAPRWSRVMRRARLGTLAIARPSSRTAGLERGLGVSSASGGAGALADTTTDVAAARVTADAPRVTNDLKGHAVAVAGGLLLLLLAGTSSAAARGRRRWWSTNSARRPALELLLLLLMILTGRVGATTVSDQIASSYSCYDPVGTSCT
jgi:hypothetical protein